MTTECMFLLKVRELFYPGGVAASGKILLSLHIQKIIQTPQKGWNVGKGREGDWQPLMRGSKSELHVSFLLLNAAGPRACRSTCWNSLVASVQLIDVPTSK